MFSVYISSFGKKTGHSKWIYAIVGGGHDHKHPAGTKKVPFIEHKLFARH